MRSATANAIKYLLRSDDTVTSVERMRVIEAMTGNTRTGDPIDLTGEVTVADAADYLKMSRTTLWRMCKRNAVVAFQRGKKFYIAGADVARLKSEVAA